MVKVIKFVTALLLTSLLSGAFALDANAQLLDRLKRKAKEAAERKAEEKITQEIQKKAEQMVEKSWNSIFGEVVTDSNSASYNLPFKFNSNVTTEDVYHFDNITTMEMETVKKDGTSDPPLIMEMHFNQNEMYSGTKFLSEDLKKENGELFIIYDFKNSAMLMLMSDDKDKFSFAYGWEPVVDSVGMVEGDQTAEEVNWDEADEWQGYSKIGSKDILGYTCDGYRSQGEKGIMEVWVSRDKTFGKNDVLKANANTKQLKGKIPEYHPFGMIMEMKSEDLESGEITTMKVTDVKQNARVQYTMTDYPTLSLGQASNMQR
jgi:hypothetical protein